MTFARFVQERFVPERVALTASSGRAHYKAIMKHILRPEDVERIFHGNVERLHTKLKAVPGWPYLGDVRLCDLRPSHIQEIVTAAAASGYSAQTAKHIRNVASSILAHAEKAHLLKGKNPASRVRLSQSICKNDKVLTFAQVKDAFIAMRHPEKEMMFIAVLTGMNLSEICGLQWKRVNLTEAKIDLEGDLIPPMSIAVRNHWYRGHLETVMKGRIRNIPISQPLFQVLLDLSKRPNFTGPGDFVLVSRAGTPLNQSNLLARRLRPLSEQLQLAPLSGQLIRRTRKALVSELGAQFQYYIATIIGSSSQAESGAQHQWRCRAKSSRDYY
jgi:integrase